MQLQCAQCHNHPFADWKQAEFWAWPAFSPKKSATETEGARQENARRGGAKLRPSQRAGGRPQKLPDSAKVVPAKFLGGSTPTVPAGESPRSVLAKWLTAPENPYFAKAMVNRLWAQFFGRGLVNPVDNLMKDNPPSHPELFEALSQQFIQSGFDVKYLVRAICNSEAYQRASAPAGQSTESAILFASMSIKPFTPHQLYDSLAMVLGESTDPIKGQGKKYKGPRPSARTAFVDYFRPGEGADPNEYPAGIPQVLRLMNAGWADKAGAVVSRAVKTDQPPARNIEKLFLATLSRRPTAAETQRLEKHLQDNKSTAAKAYTDVLWALLNSSEFSLNH